MSPPPSPRASRFIEGETVTGEPSSNPLFSDILSEMDQHESRRRSSHGSQSSSDYPTRPRALKGHKKSKSSMSSFTSNRSSKSSLLGQPYEQYPTPNHACPAHNATEARSHDFDMMKHAGESEESHKEKRSEKLLGRLRALTGGKGVERKASPED